MYRKIEKNAFCRYTVRTRSPCMYTTKERYGGPGTYIIVQRYVHRYIDGNSISDHCAIDSRERTDHDVDDECPTVFISLKR